MCTKNMKLPQLFLLYAVFSITTPVRNPLGTEKAHKLVQIYSKEVISMEVTRSYE